MGRIFSIGDLVLRGQRRSDKEGDDHISPEEWKANISEIVGELYEMASDAGLRVNEAIEDIVASGGNSYTLPGDHYETLSLVARRPDGTYGSPLAEVAAQEIPHLLQQNADERNEARFYTISGSSIWLYRKPANGTIYEHRYLRQPPDLAFATDEVEVDLFSPSGESFVSWSLAVFGRDKSETDLQLSFKLRDRAAERFAAWAQKQRSSYAAKQSFVDDRVDQTPPGRRW